MAAFLITWFGDRPAMELTALLSPTKLYHNGVLYIGYGSLTAIALIGGVAGSGWRLWTLLILVPLIPFVFWAWTAYVDNTLPEAERRERQLTAHPPSYKLLWVKQIGAPA